MDGYIEHLHCTYRVASTSAATSALPARLDRLVRERLMDAYAAALDQALGDDPAVYVLRQVDYALSLVFDSRATDAELARRWGQRMAGAVVHRIARGDDDLLRFNNQADYVARFVADLLKDTAWGCWFYGAFAAL